MVAARAHRVENQVEGLLRHLAAFGEISGVGPGRRVRHRRETIRRHRADLFGRPVPGLGHGQCAGRHGRGGAWPLPRRGVADGANRRGADLESTPAWGFSARLLLAQSYCALGRVELTAEMVAELRTRFGRHLGVFEPQLRLTEAWLAAAQGHISAAIELAVHAGEMATTIRAARDRTVRPPRCDPLW